MSTYNMHNLGEQTNSETYSVRHNESVINDACHQAIPRSIISGTNSNTPKLGEQRNDAEEDEGENRGRLMVTSGSLYVCARIMTTGSSFYKC